MNVVKGCLKDLGLGHLDEPMEVKLRQVRFISSKGSRQKGLFVSRPEGLATQKNTVLYNFFYFVPNQK